ncbi:MAG: ATP-binding cassette domain-containing protein [Erysipelotrichia bacterium]|nr:ATP-binding cassette domain-containing protein [Erysipelotrichia bacterium]
MLKIENISKTFNKSTINEKKVLNNLSLLLNKGDFVTVIGSNGAGKSTLLNTISGMYIPDEGHIYLDNKDISKLKEFQRAKFIGRVFQDPLMGTAADMLIEENLALANRRGKNRTLSIGINKKERIIFQEKLKSLNLGLEDRLSEKVGVLSGGQRQALTLLMATIQEPQILLLDEHTAALDPATAKKVLSITENLVQKNNLTTLMITHNMQDAIDYGNRLIMMDKGKIILDISGENKNKLTKFELINKFNQLTENTLENDNILLSR